jgi:hypothetical protein
MESSMGVFDDINIDTLAVQMNKTLEAAINKWGG